ncbi:MAG: hypothetical protein GXO89_13055 [Chlorobi bacterium]|nr:hypothetical protein [Chlorobiota bacterium]
MVKKIIVYSLFFVSIDLFKLTYVPTQVIYLLGFGFALMVTLGSLLIFLYQRFDRIHQNFTYEILVFLFAFNLAIVGAYTFHQQNPGLTFWVQRYSLFFFTYFFLHAIRFNVKEIERIIFIMGMIYIVFFLIQYALYPRIIFNIRIDEARGTTRIFLQGGAFATLAYFMGLYYFTTTQKPIYGIVSLLFFITIILQGTRQNLLLIGFATIVFILVSKRVKSKALIMLLLVLLAIPVFYFFQDIFMNLIAISEKQSAQQDDDVRIKAIKFFVGDFFPSPFAYLMGNGDSHMASKYGMEVWKYKIVNGLFQSDIGILGDFSKYGVFFILGVILIYIKIFRLKLTRFIYIKYYFMISFLRLFLGSDFGSAEPIVLLSTMLYMMDVDVHDQKYLKQKNLNEKD